MAKPSITVYTTRNLDDRREVRHIEGDDARDQVKFYTRAGVGAVVDLTTAELNEWNVAHPDDAIGDSRLTVEYLKPRFDNHGNIIGVFLYCERN